MCLKTIKQCIQMAYGLFILGARISTLFYLNSKSNLFTGENDPLWKTGSAVFKHSYLLSTSQCFANCI